MSVIFKVTTQYLTLTSRFNFGKCVYLKHNIMSQSIVKNIDFFLNFFGETRLEVLIQYWCILFFVVVL